MRLPDGAEGRGCRWRRWPWPLRLPALRAGRHRGLLTTNNEQQATWIRNFNPLMPENATSRWPTQFGIYEPLLVWNTVKSEAVPWLAKEWAFSEDNLTLTFTLQEGVTWSDGTPFTAKDVAFTWNLFKENAALPGNGAQTAMPRLTSIEAADDATVVFTFSEVFTVVLADIGQQLIVPEHIWSTVEDPTTFTNEEPVGNRSIYRGRPLRGPDLRASRQPQLLAGRQAGHSRPSTSGISKQ